MYLLTVMFSENILLELPMVSLLIENNLANKTCINRYIKPLIG